MADKHSQSFFGQSTGITLKSTSKSESFIFFTCIKKKSDNTWEKPTKGDGKTIKCSLEEMVMILKFLKHDINSWSIYHSYKDENTPISFNWEANGKNRVWINIGNYSKLLDEPQIEILKLLMNHLIKEKIEFATVSNISKLDEEKGFNLKPAKGNDQEVFNSENRTVKTTVINKDEEHEQRASINGSIKAETEKALLLVFDSGQEVWIPKSTIYSNYKPEVGINQIFLTDNWILKRNNIST